ncbi:MAG: DUF1275 domain-containing protein [Bacteriovoracaceae bacterium]|jgi:uncharacterized membrane protein YoaK (UPF0700 family)|nr:DUF1275 domain-containing protein [Bacteriovoracaceae bacterium]
MKQVHKMLYGEKKQMLRIDDNKHFSKPIIYFFWFLMSFQAGYVNVGGFFTSGSFVSHVTGTSSQIGMGIAKLDSIIIVTFLTVLLSFIIGAAFSGHFIGRRIIEELKPKYKLVLSVKATFFGLVLFLSTNEELSFIVNGQDIKNLLIIFFLSFCCGVQNSTCSLSTNGFLKPTHMTGLSTDIGIHLTKIFAFQSKNKDLFNEEFKKNILRITILISFIFGGVISAITFNHNGHYAFLFPFISSLCFLSMSFIQDIKTNTKQSFIFKMAKSSVVITFICTIFFAVEAFVLLS